MALIAFVEIFTEQGLASAVVQRPSITPQVLNAAFALNVVLALAAMGLLIAFAPWIAGRLRTPELAPLLRVLALTLLFQSLGFVAQAVYSRSFDYRWLALRTLLANAIGGVVGLVLVMRGHGVWGLAAQALVTSLVASLMLWLRAPWRPAADFDFHGLRGMLAYSGHIFGARAVNYGNTRFIEVFLAATLGPAALGVYAVGMRIYSALMQMLSGTVLEVAHSGFSRVAHDLPRLREAYAQATTASAALAVPVFCLTGLVAPELAETVFGARWAGSAAVMTPMALLGAVQCLQFYNGSVLNAMGKPSATLVINIAKLAATAISLLASRGAPLATVVWAFVLGQIAVSPISYAMARAAFGLSLRATARRLLPFLAACVAMIGAVLALRSVAAIGALPVLPRLVALSMGALLAYVALCGTLARGECAIVLRNATQRDKAN
jgi:O-antigen/teichoic acid export membrane protein